MNKAQTEVRPSRSHQKGILKAGRASLGLALACAPILGAAELSLDEVRDQVFAAHLLTEEQRKNLPGWNEVELTFEGLSGVIYEIWTTTDEENWEFQGSAVCEQGVGHFTHRISTADGPRYQVVVTKEMDRATPFWGRNATLNLESVGDGSIELSWSAAEDDTGVVAYALCENGEHIVTIEGAAGARVEVDGLEQGREYEYDLVAFDAAGNGTQLPDGLVLRSLLLPAVQKASKSVVDTGYDYNHSDTARSRRLEQSSPLLSPFGGEDLGELVPDLGDLVLRFGGQDLGERDPSTDPRPDLKPSLVGVPPGIGMTFRSPVQSITSLPISGSVLNVVPGLRFGGEDLGVLLPGPEEPAPGAQRSLVGVPPGIGLTFKSALKTDSRWDDADLVYVFDTHPQLDLAEVFSDRGETALLVEIHSGLGGWYFHHHHVHLSVD